MKLLLIGFLLFSFFVQARKPIPTYSPKSNSLHEAVYKGDIERVRFLIDNGADVNEKGNNKKSSKYLYNDTPLFWLRKGDIETAKLLIKHGADVNARSSFNARFGESLESIGPTPLATAIKKDDEKMAKLLIEKGVNVGKDYLLYAKSFEIAKILIENGADVNAKNKSGYTPLHFAKKSELAKLLIENGADVNAGKGTVGVPLYDTYNIKTAKLLIENGADVNAKSRYGNTPLSNARAVEVAKILIENGADVNSIAKDHETPCDKAYSEEIQNLIKEKGGVCRNLTILHRFVIDKDKTGVNRLIKEKISWLKRVIYGIKKIDINARENKDGNTALHFAEDVEIAKILIENGANINAINKKGQTPFDTIVSEEVKSFIQENGGKSGQALEDHEKLQESKKESLWERIKFF